MAWIYSLSAEFGGDKEAALTFREFFAGTESHLPDGQVVVNKSDVFQDTDGNWWSSVIPSATDRLQDRLTENKRLQEDVSEVLYRSLQGAPFFRYAIVGLEVEEFRTYNELLQEPDLSIFPGLVINKDLLEELRVPSSFRPFGSGYVWLPY